MSLCTISSLSSYLICKFWPLWKYLSPSDVTKCPSTPSVPHFYKNTLIPSSKAMPIHAFSFCYNDSTGFWKPQHIILHGLFSFEAWTAFVPPCIYVQSSYIMVLLSKSKPTPENTSLEYFNGHYTFPHFHFEAIVKALPQTRVKP